MAGSGCLAKYQCIAFLSHLGSVTPAGFAQTTLKPLFEEVPSAASGLTWRHENGRSADYFLPETTGAGCAFLDYDNDGWMDLFVAKDTVANFLFVNKRNGKFEEMGLEAGVAYSQAGRERSGMALTQRISIRTVGRSVNLKCPPVTPPLACDSSRTARLPPDTICRRRKQPPVYRQLRYFSPPSPVRHHALRGTSCTLHRKRCPPVSDPRGSRGKQYKQNRRPSDRGRSC